MAYQHLWRMIQGDNTTDALFRAWGLALSQAIQATGWVKTADTGQIDFATVTKPTLGNQQRGFEIYRPADSLQASAPWFVRIEYGSDPGAAQRCGLFITFATGTDGAGTLTGTVSNRVTVSLNTQQNTAARLWLIVGDGTQGQLGVFGGVTLNMSDCTMCWWLERTGVKGKADSRGAVMAYLGYALGSPARIGHLAQKWGGAAASGQVAPMLSGIVANPRMAGHYDTGSIVHPVFYSLGDGFLQGPVHGFFLVDEAAIPVGVTTDVPHDGGTVTGYVSAWPNFYSSNQAGATAYYKPVMRWN